MASVRRRRAIVGYLAGLQAGAILSSIAAIVVGAILRMNGWLSAKLAWSILLALTVPLVLREFRLISFRLPQNARLVPESVFRFGWFIGSFQFGLEMGSGIRTFVTSSLPYILACSLILVTSPAAAISSTAGFAAGRGLMTLLSIRERDPFGWADTFKKDWTYSVLSPLVMVTLLSVSYLNDFR